MIARVTAVPRSRSPVRHAVSGMRSRCATPPMGSSVMLRVFTPKRAAVSACPTRGGRQMRRSPASTGRRRSRLPVWPAVVDQGDPRQQNQERRVNIDVDPAMRATVHDHRMRVEAAIRRPRVRRRRPHAVATYPRSRASMRASVAVGSVPFGVSMTFGTRSELADRSSRAESPASPIEPSPISSCRSRCESNGVFESLRCITRRRVEPDGVVEAVARRRR